MARSRKNNARPALPIGGMVLLGMPGVSMPADWHIGRVVWTDGVEVLVEQYGLGGNNPHKALHDAGYVRAIGDVPTLGAFRRKAEAAVDGLWQQVRDAEVALGAARDAVWAKLDEIGAAVPALDKAEPAPAGEGR